MALGEENGGDNVEPTTPYWPTENTYFFLREKNTYNPILPYFPSPPLQRTTNGSGGKKYGEDEGGGG